MKHVIATLKNIRQYELSLIGKSPTTLFIGNQQDHDEYHTKLAKEYGDAIEVLKKYKK